jgi:NAD(P)-dependent dehydrogenase (short-subunit alcohol dehydrogenase family)
MSAAKSLFSLAGKTAVVSGGGRGIGLGIAKAMAQSGVEKLFISSRSAETLKRAAAAINEQHGKEVVVPIGQDLANDAGCKALAEQVQKHLGENAAIDALVNNSGIAWGAPFAEFPEAQWHKVMNLNVAVPFFLTRAFRPMLEKASNGGSVINIGSVVGVTPQPFPTYSYDTSKAALHHLTKKLSSELAPKIRVNAIAPGFVPSRMSAGLKTYVSEEDVRKAIPMARWGDAEKDIGSAAVFLASDASSWITGNVLVVDGGQSARPLTMVPGANESD